MSAPNKIYLNYPKEKMDSDIATWDTKTFADCKNIEYIRKDYLLEWAKGEQNKCSDETHPYAMFMNVVINKLNEI